LKIEVLRNIKDVLRWGDEQFIIWLDATLMSYFIECQIKNGFNELDDILNIFVISLFYLTIY